ncbi:MAG TPA: hypothetical protein VGZ32_26415 [Actinocrinis sp.]|uniref:hypothetical protein n=1 Tax=Actinocrinis sp. TaxID=1920516 RepID=UPI002DDD59C2|nr:hypothetical protein [Actinocrinis sp.]HEV3173913.1 hypothetical protein [Actinocrinis sp.]
MGSFLRPVGPQPPAVYWRRRIIVVGIPLVLIGLLAYSCSGPGSSPAGAGSHAATSASPSAGIITPSAGATGYPPINSYPVVGPTGSPGAGASGSAGAGGANGGTGGNTGGSTGGAVTGVSGSGGCLLSVTVQLDKTAPNGSPVYAAGQNPTFSVILHNQGSANCRLDVSGKGVVVTVASVDSSTPVWTTATCAGPADLRVLGPGDGFNEQVKWNRQQSQTGCPPNPPTVGAGAYAVAASVGGVASASVQFQLQ